MSKMELTILTAILVLLFSQQQPTFGDPSVVPDVRPQWIAGINKRFANIPSHQLIQDLHLDATYQTPSPQSGRLKNLSKLKVKTDDSFETTAQWPKCADTMLTVRDQGACSGWASIVASVMTDLTCIVCLGTYQPYLSDQDLLSCSGCGNCTNARMKDAFDYWYSTGVVTGGPYGSATGCLPYYYPPRHGKPPNYTPAPIPACSSTCQRGYPANYKSDKHEGDHFTTFDSASEIISYEPETMKGALSTYGPVIAIMSIYEDFMYNYTSGVYYHQFGKLLGKTPVKVIGYGIDGTIPYWLAVNSWGPEWGMAGLFKIYRNGKECDFEEKVLVAAGAALSSCFSYDTSTSSSKRTTATTKTSKSTSTSSSTSSSSTSSSSSSSGTTKGTSSSSTTKSNNSNAASRFVMKPVLALVMLVFAFAFSGSKL